MIDVLFKMIYRLALFFLFICCGRSRQGSFPVMGGNVLDITLQDVAEGVDRVHVDALIVLQAVDQRFTDMMFFM